MRGEGERDESREQKLETYIMVFYLTSFTARGFIKFGHFFLRINRPKCRR